MFGRVAAFIAAGMLAASPALAADVNYAKVSATGSVVVSQDGKLAPLSGATTLKVGDRVVSKDGSAQLQFADGCKITLKANTMATIADKSPCASPGAGLVSATNGDNAQLFNLTWFGTALVAIGVVALLFLVFDDDDPKSP